MSRNWRDYDPARNRWTWDPARIEARQITKNVVQLMTKQIQRLPMETQQALQHAACIGNRFDLATLAAVSAPHRNCYLPGTGPIRLRQTR